MAGIFKAFGKKKSVNAATTEAKAQRGESNDKHLLVNMHSTYLIYAHDSGHHLERGSRMRIVTLRPADVASCRRCAKGILPTVGVHLETTLTRRPTSSSRTINTVGWLPGRGSRDTVSRT
jgi:hypothetical protein